MTRLVLILLAATAAAPMSHAAELAMASRIDAVTVFPDAAAVTRIGEVRVPQGQHLIVLKGLPASLDPSSIRVEASSDGDLAIASADVRRVAAAPIGDEVQAKLKGLRGELARAKGRIEALEAQKRAVADFARLAAEAAAKEGKGFDLTQVRAAWAAVGEGTAAANDALQGESQRAAEIEAEIRALEAAMVRPRPGFAPMVDLAVAVEAGREVGARLTVTYRVGGARWTALYDAGLDTVANGAVAKLSLVRRAAVTQVSGEDWTDVALTLSTARVAGGSSVPEVATQALTLSEPIVVLNADPRNRRVTGAAPAGPEMSVAMSAAPSADLAKAAEREAASVVSPFSAAFVVPGRVSVARDGTRRALRLSSHVLDAPLMARVAPAFEPRAYLSTNLIWTDEVPLLAGEVSLSRDGVFVGKAQIAATAPGDQVELGFGADDRIKVERVPVRRSDNDPSGWNASRTQISHHRTTITNLHRRPMRISVIDRIPVSENSAITVEPLTTNTPPTERVVQDRRGVMGWTHDYAPGERREIRLGWRLRWPADREIGGL